MSWLRAARCAGLLLFCALLWGSAAPLTGAMADGRLGALVAAIMVPLTLAGLAAIARRSGGAGAVAACPLAPTVLVNRTVEGVESVVPEYAVGIAELVEHLIGLGHRGIGHLTGGGGAARLRAEGFAAAMAAAGLEPRTVADFYAEYRAHLADLGVTVAIDPVPVELPSPKDRR